jgi:hypothetical protein
MPLLRDTKLLGRFDDFADELQMKLLGVTALVGVGAYAIWTAFGLVNAPSTEEAMQLSLKALEIPGLETAYALHRDACSITKVSIWTWSVECEGVPMHFYQDVTYCESRSPKVCAATASSDTNCRSYYWFIDLDGKPSAPIGKRKGYASIMSDCKPKGSFDSERMEMARRGLRPSPVEIGVPAGSITDKPGNVPPARPLSGERRPG